ncbi:hypothetical protein ACMYSQ_000090 [Aspergillus niger]
MPRTIRGDLKARTGLDIPLPTAIAHRRDCQINGLEYRLHTILACPPIAFISNSNHRPVIRLYGVSSVDMDHPVRTDRVPVPAAVRQYLAVEFWAHDDSSSGDGDESSIARERCAQADRRG